MAYDVSALANYTKENEDLLVTSSLFGAKTQKLIQAEGNVMAGVKSSEKINIIDTDAVFQTGGTCGFSSSGTTTFTQRTVAIGKIKVNEALCPKALEAKYTQKALAIGSQYESVPFEAEYTDKKAGKIAEALETAIWQGDTGAGGANLNKFDGLIKLIDAAAASVDGNPGAITVAVGITTANVIGIIDNMWSLLPAAVKGKSDVKIVCGWDVFEKYIIALRAANLFHYNAENTDGEFMIPGTQYKLVALHGLDSTNRLFAMRTSNLFLGVDLQNEEERWEIFFAKEADEVRFVTEFKMGVNVAFPAEIVEFTLVP
jgi:hypothetical protein